MNFFEDNWPEKGDYDLNDVVIKLQSALLMTPENEVKQLSLVGELKSMGASYRNGFAIELEGVIDSQIDSTNIRFEINGTPVTSSLIEGDTTYSVLKVTDNLWKYVEPDTGCKFYKTEPGCQSISNFVFTIKIPFYQAIPLVDFPTAPYNPFIFATPNTYHGDSFSSHPGRGLEIHLKNKRPTSKANLTYFNTLDDVSTVDFNFSYQTSTGMPWAMTINSGSSENWYYPAEYVDIIKAYPQFENFVLSEGSENPLWFSNANAVADKIYEY